MLRWLMVVARSAGASRRVALALGLILGVLAPAVGELLAGGPPVVVELSGSLCRRFLQSLPSERPGRVPSGFVVLPSERALRPALFGGPKNK